MRRGRYTVTISPDLMAVIDQLAEQNRTSRSQVIEQVLANALKAMGFAVPELPPAQGNVTWARKR